MMEQTQRQMFIYIRWMPSTRESCFAIPEGKTGNILTPVLELSLDNRSGNLS
jgi:hypothetical protein